LIWAIQNEFAESKLIWIWCQMKGDQDAHAKELEIDVWAKLKIEMDHKS